MGFLIWVALGVGLVGVLLLGIGLRGRRVLDHARCRKCSYDLRWLSEEQLAQGGVLCPECGRDLSSRGAVRMGLRRKRPWLVVSGLVMLLLALGGGGYQGFVVLMGPEGYQYKPAWLLRRDVLAGDKAAWQELHLRDARGSLSEGWEIRLIDQLLDKQDLPEVN